MLSSLFYTVNRIKLVKPEKAQAIEDMIIRAAQMGSLGGVVDEQRLIALLEQIQQQTETKSTVTVVCLSLSSHSSIFLFIYPYSLTPPNQPTLNTHITFSHRYAANHSATLKRSPVIKGNAN
jgi:programmed cell death protein 5